MAAGHPEIASSELPDYIDTLEEFLEHPNADYDGMLVTELDGYLAGIVTSANMIMPSQWLPPIWGENGQPEFDDEEQAQKILGAVMEMYNDTNKALERGAYGPLYDIDNDDTPIWELWIEGFWTAIILQRNAWAAMLADEQNPERQCAAMTITRLHQLSHRYETGEKLREGDDAFLKNAADILPVAVEILYKYRNQTLVSNTNTKIGRNDPCPCGSGKKFKKCCLH